MELLRHYTHHRHRLAIQPQRAPDNVGVSRETSPPEPVVQDDDIIPPGTILVRGEYAAKGGLDSKQREEFGRSLQAIHPLGRLSGIGQVERLRVHSRQEFEVPVLGSKIEKVRRRMGYPL